jgi:hypothetical protein
MADKTTTAISEFTGEPVSTWSEESRHECEGRAVLAMSKEQRDAFFNGVPGDGKERGIVALRGQAAAERIYEDCKRLRDMRERRAKGS